MTWRTGRALFRGRPALLAVPAILALAPAAPAAQAGSPVTEPVLAAAAPTVVALPFERPRAPIRLSAGIADWHGAPSNIAGTAHYDRGEWIYENYPYTAYGAASPETVLAYQALGIAGSAAPRTPSAVSLAQASAGAGPLQGQADLWQLRLAVRGGDLYVLGRTTQMSKPVQSALLLLFDTGRGGGVTRSVPFGSGLETSKADVAVLVTASGARIVDLVTGRSTDAPAVADPRNFDNSLETRLPLALVQAADGLQLKLVGGTGLVTPGSYTLQPGGAGGPLDAVFPRFDEPVQTVYDRAQALALAGHDVDRFLTTISLGMLRDGASQRLAPGIGYSIRTFTRPAWLSDQTKAAQGTVQEYGLYVPPGLSGAPAPATLFLAGSGFTASEHATLEPNLFRQLGDENHALVITPGSGYPPSDLSLYEGADYLYIDEALADAEHDLSIDPDRLTLAGYSMGGFGTFLFASTQPDRFAAGFSIEGPVSGTDQISPPDTTLTDLLPLAQNMRYTPIEIYQTAEDENVPVFNGLDAARTLRGLGYRYQLNIYQGDHYGPGLLDDYTYGQRMLDGARLVTAPAEVHFARNMSLEHEIDTGFDSNEPLKGRSVGLRFDHAWFVQDLDATDPVNGVATIDVRTLARRAGTITPVHTDGVDPGYNGEVPSPFDEQQWHLGPLAGRPANALSAMLTGASHVTLELRPMGLTAARRLTATIGTDTRATIVLAFSRPYCVNWSVDGRRRPAEASVRSLATTLEPGRHTIEMRPCSGGRSRPRASSG